MRQNRGRGLRGTILPLALLGIAVTAGVAVAAAPTQTFTASIKPTKLSKHGFTPVVARFDLDIASSDANPPPPLQSATISFDKQVKVDARGLPVCQPARLNNTDTASARKACPKAIIGSGFASAKVAFPSQSPIDAPAPVVLFNGPPRGGSPTIIIHAYTTVPAPTTFIVPGVFRNNQVTFTVPPIAGGYGTLVHIDLTFSRRYKVKGHKKSFANAKCAKGKLTALGDFVYQDGTRNHTVTSVTCKGK